MRLKLTIFIGLVIFLIGLVIYQTVHFFDKKLHIVFCDVGQGDAIFIRTPTAQDILIDSGPNQSVLECLERHMPFWDRTIELAVLTHPHSDHYAGYLEVINSYTIERFVREDLSNPTEGYTVLQNLIQKKRIPEHVVYKGDRFKIGSVVITMLSPSRQFIEDTSPNGIVGEREEFASLIPLVTFGTKKILLTGDTQSRALLEAIQDFDVTSVSVLQVPHHGSKTGLTQEILEILTPHLAVISVGKNNRYHHPAFSTITLLQKNDIPFLMTKDEEDIEIVSDGVAVSRFD